MQEVNASEETALIINNILILSKNKERLTKCDYSKDEGN
jgi:hypothetical protein